LEKIGAGGMGEVFRARDDRLGRDVAIKTFGPGRLGDETARKRLRREARLLSRLNHPNVVSVYDFDSSPDLDFLVMEFVPGSTLATRLRQGVLPENDVVCLALQMVDGLAAAHDHGIVHGDFKSANVIITPDNRVKILDFGLAGLIRAAATDAVSTESVLAPAVSGTLPYMAPEQLLGRPVDAHSDIYSLGVTLYEAVAGRLPFCQTPAPALTEAILHRAPPPPSRFQPSLSPKLEEIVLKCLEKAPGQRYQSVKEIAVDLRRLSGAAVPAETPRARPRWRWLRVLAAAGVLALVLLTAPRAPFDKLLIPTAHAEQITVAVLPFQNAAGDSKLNYLQLALPDEIATALGHAPRLAVRPLDVSRKYLNTQMDAAAAGRELRVQTVIAGYYAREGPWLRVTMEAIQPQSRDVLWRETVRAPDGSMLELRARLASRLWQGLTPALGGTPAGEPSTRPANSEAYDLYLHSISIPHEWAENREAARMLERALELDPNYAPAWSAIAERYHYDAFYFAGGAAVLRQATAAAERALELDPALIAATVQSVTMQAEAGQIERAYDQAELAVRRRPDSGLAHFALSYALRYGGLFEEAAVECETALRLDPTNYQFRSCAITLEMVGQHSHALDFARLDAGTSFVAWRQAYISLDIGNTTAAVAVLNPLIPDFVEAQFGSECLQHPHSPLLPDLSERAERLFAAGSPNADPENLYVDARIQAVCRQDATALRMLRRSVEAGYCAYPILDTDPLFVHLRPTREFGDIRRLAAECQARFLRHREERNRQISRR
jgi:tRNA A-37 threonylcarbamoyl transferase component Bud32/TolB-like protein